MLLNPFYRGRIVENALTGGEVASFNVQVVYENGARVLGNDVLGNKVVGNDATVTAEHEFAFVTPIALPTLEGGKVIRNQTALILSWLPACLS